MIFRIISINKYKKIKNNIKEIFLKKFFILVNQINNFSYYFLTVL